MKYLLVKRNYIVQYLLMFLLVLPLEVIVSSCSDEDPAKGSSGSSSSAVSITTVDMTIDSDGGELSFTFSAVDVWRISSEVNWITLNKYNGSAGTVVVTATVEPNNSLEERNGAITVTCRQTSAKFTITQKQLVAVLLSSNKVEAPSEGCDAYIDIESGISYNVRVDEACKSWVHIVQTKSVETNRLVLHIDRNIDTEKREGKVRVVSDVKAETINIYQQGSEPGIVLSENEINASGYGETVKVELLSNISYEIIMPDVDWISECSTRSVSSYTHYFVVSENNSEESREAKIVFRSPDMGVSESVTIKQDPKGAHITGTWYLGWWISGSTGIHFDGTEAITFGDNVLTWAGQQDSTGNGEYQLEYAADGKSFVLRKTGYEKRFYIRYISQDILAIQESDVYGAIRYWFRTAEAANASQRSDLPDIETDENEIADPAHKELTDVEDILKLRTGLTDSQYTPMGKHFEGTHQTTAADIAWLLNPENEPDHLTANENSASPTLTKWKPFAVTLYPFGSPEPADVNQHAIGDCSFCAVMASMAYLYPDFIKDIIKDNGDGTYTVRLFDPDGKNVDVCVKSTFLCNSSGTLAQVTGKNNEPTWSAVLEKALMKYLTIYKVSRLWGIGSDVAAPIVTGDGGSFAFYPNQLWNGELKLIADWSVDEGMIGVGGFTVSNLECGSLYTVTAHAFTIMKTNHASDGYLFSMRNPWGITSYDGVMDIPDTRLVCSTIDFRIINPGAAKPFLRTNRGAYIPPKWSDSQGTLGVANSLLKMSNCNSVMPSPFYPY